MGRGVCIEADHIGGLVSVGETCLSVSHRLFEDPVVLTGGNPNWSAGRAFHDAVVLEQHRATATVAVGALTVVPAA